MSHDESGLRRRPLGNDPFRRVDPESPSTAYRCDVSMAQRERAGLIEVMRAVGPDAATLCGSWTTRDLAAHLVVRERRPDALPGILFKPLAPYTARVQSRLVASTAWEDLVAMIAAGPPVLSPFKLLDPVASIHEMFVHHEDVRRAQTGWEPRELDSHTTAAIRRRVGIISRAAMSTAMAAVPARVTMRTADGRTVTAVGHGAPVTVTGEPQELLLFAFGRNAVRVEFEGDDDVVAAVRAADRGF
jgi:uncharacterized protein (TIGR03085 family)